MCGKDFKIKMAKSRKTVLRILDVIAAIIMVVWNLVEILAIPAFFSFIGWLNNYPWQYYAATIGGFFVIAGVIQLVCHFLFKRLEKKYESVLVRFFSKIFGEKVDEQE